jgi:hypothetical protein
MPSPNLIHRDTALLRTGYMPAREHGTTDAEWERQKAAAATQLEKNEGAEPFGVDKKRARRYREDRIDAIAARIVKPLPRKVAA